jgi:hypothetical protein
LGGDGGLVCAKDLARPCREDALLASVSGEKGKRKRERVDGEYGVIKVLAMARFAAVCNQE